MSAHSSLIVATAVAVGLATVLPTAAHAAPPTITIADGNSTLYSGGGAYVAAPGVQLRPCDIVATGPQSLVQVELEDGGRIELGPESRLIFDLPIDGDAVVGPHYLLSGWLKLTVPRRDKAPPYRLDMPQFAFVTNAGVASLHSDKDGGAFFLEQGDAVVLPPGGAAASRLTVPAGKTYLRKSGQPSGTIVDRADPGFVQSMPVSFRDTLPALLERLKNKNVRPAPAQTAGLANVESWFSAVPGLRSCISDQSVRNAQKQLTSAGFAVGPIDGILGPQTRGALTKFQEQRGLARTGRLDPDTVKALESPERR